MDEEKDLYIEGMADCFDLVMTELEKVQAAIWFAYDILTGETNDDEKNSFMLMYRLVTRLQQKINDDYFEKLDEYKR